VGTSNIIVGGMNQQNRDLIAANTSTGEETLPVGFLSVGKPYVELGYGVENIFKFLRVDFIHRVSYLENQPDTRSPRKFGVFFSFQFSL
jgi:hypothetical protein